MQKTIKDSMKILETQKNILLDSLDFLNKIESTIIYKALKKSYPNYANLDFKTQKRLAAAEMFGYYMGAEAAKKIERKK